ncbi:MAG: DUF2397 family protein [bacterium]
MAVKTNASTIFEKRNTTPDSAPTLLPPQVQEPERDSSEAQRAGMMLRLFGTERLAFFESERAAFYLNILYKMLLLRREHELQPPHEDLYYAVREGQLLLAADYDLNQFAADVAQLLAWGNLTKVLEPYRLRSYKDLSRENYRYVLNENTVAFLQWLEYRVRTRSEGRSRDGRNFLQDIVAALQEFDRLCSAATLETDLPEETARRALHLRYAIEDHIHDLSAELLEFRATMVQFVTRAYDIETLKAILLWLSRYVEVYLQGIYHLRERILELIARLDTAATRGLLANSQALIAEQRRQMPQALRGELVAEPADAEEFLRHVHEFFARDTKLDELCERIHATAREVIKKMDAKLRELERRNTRIHDLKARIRELASAPVDLPRAGNSFSSPDRLFEAGEEGECRAGYHFINALLLPSHARLDAQYWDLHTKAAPPRPRSRAQSSPSVAPKSYLKSKAHTKQEIYALEAKKREELRQWLMQYLLNGQAQIRLAGLELRDPRAAVYWMKLMHFVYVTPTRDLQKLRVQVRKLTRLAETPASVVIGSATANLYTPDHLVIDLRAEGVGQRAWGTEQET